MCVEINNVSNATMEYSSSKKVDSKKMSYSLKKVLKAIFKKQKKIATHSSICKASSLESIESLENQRNAEAEILSENEANERIYAASSGRSSSASNPSIFSEDHYDEASIYVPVHFARTANGIFFWTAASTTAPDADLMEPLDCCTDNQIAVPQFGDRWAQA